MAFGFVRVAWRAENINFDSEGVPGFELFLDTLSRHRMAGGLGEPVSKPDRVRDPDESVSFAGTIQFDRNLFPAV